MFSLKLNSSPTSLSSVVDRNYITDKFIFFATLSSHFIIARTIFSEIVAGILAAPRHFDT